MPRRTLLAEQLSGIKRNPIAQLPEDSFDKQDREKQSNFRRLSTLYGSNVNTVQMTKQRRKSRIGVDLGVGDGAVGIGR